tara:strand:+ start:67 stop:963 length:897 start_codon:yes stop_codon:yes gene_type:complete
MIIYITILFSFLFSYNGYDSIYNIISSPRNNAIGGVHMPTNNINSMFDAPLELNHRDKSLFISINDFNRLLTTYHIGYCLYSNQKMNLSLGLVRREIYNNYNTQDAWIDDGYPDLEELNYDMISLFSDKQTGLLLSYNKILNKNFILGVNFKTELHKIGYISAVGYAMDIRTLLNLDKVSICFGIDDLFAVKEWETDFIENNNINGYISIAMHALENFTLFYEYGTHRDFIFGTEMKLVERLSLRWGFSNMKDMTLSFGVGFDLKNINLEYTYKDNMDYILGNNHILGFTLKLHHFSE